jgi:hypothetical protein
MVKHASWLLCPCVIHWLACAFAVRPLPFIIKCDVSVRLCLGVDCCIFKFVLPLHQNHLHNTWLHLYRETILLRVSVMLALTFVPHATQLYVACLALFRGEIACRVLTTARRLGIPTVAIFSEADRDAKFVRLADEAYCIGPPPARDSYLRGDVILQVAQEAGVDAIHPGRSRHQ